MAVYPQFDPFVQQSSVVEFTEEARLGNGVRRVAHLTSTASDVAKVVVALLAQYGRTTHQRHGFLILRRESHFMLEEIHTTDRGNKKNVKHSVTISINQYIHQKYTFKNIKIYIYRMTIIKRGENVCTK